MHLTLEVGLSPYSWILLNCIGKVLYLLRRKTCLIIEYNESSIFWRGHIVAAEHGFENMVI